VSITVTTNNDKDSKGKGRRRRVFGAVRQLPSGRWQARHRNKQGRLVPAPRTFPTKTDATKYLTLIEAEQIRGSHYDPKRGQTKFGVWADQWLKGATLRPKTRTLYAYLLRRFVKPTFADIALNNIDDTVAVDWLAELRELPEISETTVAKAYRLFARIMGAAVESRYIVHTTWKVKGAGRERSPEMRLATPEQVSLLASKVPARYRALILVAAYGGLRWGELVNLRRRHVDLRRGTVQVVEQATELAGRFTVAPVKSEAGRRTVKLPASVLAVLREHPAHWAEPGLDSLVLPASQGGFLRHSNFRRRVWLPATRAAKLEGLRFYDLRHTAATLAVVAGATTKELMARMGHSTPDMAIRYQHIMQGRDAIIAAGLDRLIQAAGDTKPNGTDVARQGRKPRTRSGVKGSDQRGNVVPSTGFEPAAYCSGGSRSFP
jgi:integrase